MVYQYRPLDLAIHRYNQRFFRDVASAARLNFTVTQMTTVETDREDNQRVKIKINIDRHMGLDQNQIANLGPIPRVVEKTLYATRAPLHQVLSTVVPCDARGRYVLNFHPGTSPTTNICQALNQLGLMISPTELKVKALGGDGYLLTVTDSLIAYGNAYLYRDGGVRLYGPDRLCDHQAGIILDPTGFSAQGIGFQDNGLDRRSTWCGLITRYQQFGFDRYPSVCLDETAYQAGLWISLVYAHEHNIHANPTDVLAKAIHIRLIPRGAEIFVQGVSVHTAFFEPETWVSLGLLPDRLVISFSKEDQPTQNHTVWLANQWQGAYNLKVCARTGFSGKVLCQGIVDESLMDQEPATPRLKRTPMIFGDTHHIIEYLANKGLYRGIIPLSANYTTSPIMGNQVRCVFTSDTGVLGQVDYEQPNILSVLQASAAANNIPFDGQTVLLPTVQAQSPDSMTEFVQALNDLFKTPFKVSDFEPTADVLRTRGVVWCNPKQGQYTGGVRFQCVNKTLA